MSWPMSTDYQEAMQNTRTALGDPELQQGEAEVDSLGLPRPISGGFATVYKVVCAHRAWAVRCFLREFKDQQQRYAKISAQLAASRFSFATQFQYIDRGIRVRGDWYPVVKMEWIRGEGLHRFVEGNLASPQRLLGVGQDIVDLAREMNRAGVAHGDLQHGNILVANGKPKLIDYDGMYVPAMQGWPTHEAGHPNYQPLLRDDITFGPGLDNFSVWVIYLSLRALSVRPSLWKQFDGGDDCLLFRRKDYEMPAQSRLLRELKGVPEVRHLASQFEALLKCHPLKVPFIDPGSAASPRSNSLPDWIEAAQSSAPPSPSRIALDAHWAQIDQIPRPSNVDAQPSVPAATHRTPWPPTLPRTIPAQPVAQSILWALHPWPGSTNLAPAPPQPVLPPILSALPPWPGPTSLAPVPPQPERPRILLSPELWGGPTGLPRIPPKPILPELLTSPPCPPAMVVPPLLRFPRHVPVTEEQRFIKHLTLIVGVVFVPLGFVVWMIVAIVASSSRIVPVAGLLGLLTLFTLFVLGLVWGLMERDRRKSEKRKNQERENELAELYAQSRRRKEEWEDDLAKKQYSARVWYEQEYRNWQDAVSRQNAEFQRQQQEWEQEQERRRDQAQQQYDRELKDWQGTTALIRAEALRQQREWEEEQKRRRAQAQEQYDRELKDWQNTTALIRAEAQRQQKKWEEEQKRSRDQAQQQYDREFRAWQETIAAIQAEKGRRQQAAADAQKKLTAAEQNWHTLASRFVEDFDRKKGELRRFKSDYEDIERQCEHEWKQMLATARDRQLALHLSRQLVEGAAIPNIGRELKARLQECGLKTASDMTSAGIGEIPGFGPERTKSVMEWRHNVEATFIFMPAHAIPLPDKQAFETRYHTRRQQIQRQLSAGECALRQIAQDAELQLRIARDQIKQCLTQLNQAKADLTAVPSGL